MMIPFYSHNFNSRFVILILTYLLLSNQVFMINFEMFYNSLLEDLFNFKLSSISMDI